MEAVDSAGEALAVNTVAASTAVLPGTTTPKEADPASTAGTTASEAKAAQGCEASGATFAAGEVVEAACTGKTTLRALDRCTGFRSGETTIWPAGACRPTEAEAKVRTQEDPEIWTTADQSAAASIPPREAKRAGRTM